MSPILQVILLLWRGNESDPLRIHDNIIQRYCSGWILQSDEFDLKERKVHVWEAFRPRHRPPSQVLEIFSTHEDLYSYSYFLFYDLLPITYYL